MPGVKTQGPAQSLELALLRAAALVEFMPTMLVMVYNRSGGKYTAEYEDKLPPGVEVQFTLKWGRPHQHGCDCPKCRA